MIEFYGFNASQPGKTYQHGITTLGAFIDGLGVNRKAHFVQPIDIVVNGAHIPSCQWDATHILPHDDIKAYQTAPHGGIFKGLAGIIGGVLSFAFGWLTPSQGGANANVNAATGEKIDPASVKANTANLNAVVPESFGRCRIFPDYLTMPRRYYKDRRVQMLEFSACVGVGRYAFEQSDIRISDSPIAGLPDARVTHYQPGDDLSADPVHLNWYTSPEVGGTSSGTAGLELSTEQENRTNENPAEYLFNAYSVSRTEGDFPPGWGSGTTVRIRYASSYVVSLHVVNPSFPYIPASAFTGYFGHMPMSGAFTSGIFEGWEPQVIAGDAAGEATVIFRRPSSDEDWPYIYLSGIPNGTAEYVFGDLYDRVLASSAESEITLQAYPFQANTTKAGATIEFTGGQVNGEWSGPFMACPAGQKTGTLELDFLFPNGLMRLDDDGNSQNHSVSIEVQFRDNGSGAWQSRTYTYTDATRDNIGFTEQISVPGIRPQVRVRRLGARADSNQIFDVVNWFGLKCLLPGRSVYPDWTTITASFESGGKIAAQSENRINIIATRILPVFSDSGAILPPQPTRDIIAACRYVWSTINYTDADADLDEFMRLHLTYWKPRGETFDASISSGTVLDTLNTILGAGMAEVTIDGGLIKPVRDERRTVGMEERKLSFSDLSTVGDISEDFAPWVPDDYDGCEAEYTDPVTFEPETVRYVLAGKPGIKIETIKLVGVTDRRRAWIIAARRVLANFYRRHRVSFRTEMSGFNARYWSFIAAISNDPLISQSAYILRSWRDADGNLLLQSSETLQVEEGASYVAAYRSLEGKFIGPFAVDVNLIISGKTIVLPPSAPMPERISGAEPPHLYFGKAEEIEKSFLVEGVTFSSMKNADIKAVNYAEEVFSEDDNTPPEQ